MYIAVTYENGNVFQHFGHTEQFKIYSVDDGKVVAAYGEYHTSDKLTAGREVVDYIVAKVCYFMGTAGDV